MKRTATRRHLLGAMGTAVAAGVAGCSESTIPDTFEATPAEIPDATLTDTGYTEVGVQDRRMTQQPDAVDKEITVVNWQSTYRKAIELPTGEVIEAAEVILLSTPQIRVIGQEFNPIADFETEQVISEIENRSTLSNLEPVDEEIVTILEKEITVTEVTGDRPLGELNQTAEVTAHIGGPIEDSGDYILAVGGYPTALEGGIPVAIEGEREDVFTMLTGITHEL